MALASHTCEALKHLACRHHVTALGTTHAPMNAPTGSLSSRWLWVSSRTAGGSFSPSRRKMSAPFDQPFENARPFGHELGNHLRSGRCSSSASVTGHFTNFRRRQMPLSRPPISGIWLPT